MSPKKMMLCRFARTPGGPPKYIIHTGNTFHPSFVAPPRASFASSSHITRTILFLCSTPRFTLLDGPHLPGIIRTILMRFECWRHKLGIHWQLELKHVLVCAVFHQ